MESVAPGIDGSSYSEDAIVNTGGCGAHTCWDNYYIISGDNGTVQNIVEPPSSRDEWGKSVLWLHSAESNIS